MIGGSAAMRLSQGGSPCEAATLKRSDEELLDNNPKSIYLPSRYGIEFVTLM